jgi:hypothetical protein
MACLGSGRAAMICATLVMLCAAAPPDQPRIGSNTVVVRGKPQRVHYLPARNLPEGVPAPRLFFAPAGAWTGFASTIAENMASWGYEVYGLDTRRYLRSFPDITGPQERGDMRTLAEWADRGRRGRCIFVGWEQGAALGAVALSAPAGRSVFRGLAAISLPASMPNLRPGPRLPEVYPAPVFLISASADSDARRLFGDAREPKQLRLIDAAGELFQGNRDALLKTLHEAILWIVDNSQ